MEDVERRRARQRRIGLWSGIVLSPILVPLLVLVVVLYLLIYVLVSLFLRLLVLVLWMPRGYRVLVVYSNSPHWQDYFEQRVIPTLGSCCVVLNWSERRRWSFNLATMLFWFHGGHRAYNPLVVVLRPWGRAQVFRFWAAFRDARHGRPEPLQRLETEFRNVVQAICAPSPQ